MKISARELKTSFREFTGEAVLAFKCSRNALAWLDALKMGDYELSITKPSKKRTGQQNAYLWELLGKICMKEDGNKAGDIDLYCQLVEQAGIKCEYLMGLPETEAGLKKVFRVVKTVDSRNYNGQQMSVFKCFYGSSKMNTEEMGRLIDKAIERAEAIGIDTEYWRDVLNESERRNSEIHAE